MLLLLAGGHRFVCSWNGVVACRIRFVWCQREHPALSPVKSRVLGHVAVEREPRGLPVVGHRKLVWMEYGQRDPHVVTVVEWRLGLSLHPLQN